MEALSARVYQKKSGAPLPLNKGLSDSLGLGIEVRQGYPPKASLMVEVYGGLKVIQNTAPGLTSAMRLLHKKNLGKFWAEISGCKTCDHDDHLLFASLCGHSLVITVVCYDKRPADFRSLWWFRNPFRSPSFTLSLCHSCPQIPREHAAKTVEPPKSCFQNALGTAMMPRMHYECTFMHLQKVKVAEHLEHQTNIWWAANRGGWGLWTDPWCFCDCDPCRCDVYVMFEQMSYMIHYLTSFDSEQGPIVLSQLMMVVFGGSTLGQLTQTNAAKRQLDIFCLRRQVMPSQLH